jgi:hypothetical protein
MYKWRKIILAASLLFALALCVWGASFLVAEWGKAETQISGAKGANPEDALSAKPKDSVFIVARVDDLGGMLKHIFSPANVEMFMSFADMKFMVDLASQIPAQSAVFATGMTSDLTPFLQMSAAMPERFQPKLDLVAQGKATPEDVMTLLLGEGELLLSERLDNPTVENGPKGPYYALIHGGPVLAARDNLLVIASSPDDLNASLAALEKAENRLAFKRRFKSPNYWLMHMDMPTIASFLKEEMAEELMGEINFDAASSFFQFLKLFRAPLEMELAFDVKPKNLLISGGVNLFEAVADMSRWRKRRPTPGAGLFLAGGGQLLMGLSNASSFKANDWKVHPEFAAGWNRLMGQLSEMGITEKDIEDLLTGNISIVWGSDATILGQKAKGGYVAVSGQNGAAGKILNAVVKDFARATALLSFLPMKAKGWESLFMVSFPLLQAPLFPLLTGVMGDTFFLGVVDSAALNKKPRLPREAAKLFKEKLFTAGFFDGTTAWAYAKKELSSFARNRRNESVEANLKNILDADLSVKSVKLWAPTLETSFTELTFVDVPQEKRLLPKLVNLAAFMSRPSASEDEASIIISSLRNLKAASMMFYADSMDEVADGKADALINAEGSVKLLLPYVDNPEAYSKYIFKCANLEGNYRWLVGDDLSDRSPSVKERLQERTGTLGLIDENGNTYSGGDLVFMIAR